MSSLQVDPYAAQREEVLTTLRELTEQAERGEIIGLALAVIRPEAATSVRWTTHTGVADTIGRLMLLVHRLSAADWEDG